MFKDISDLPQDIQDRIVIERKIVRKAVEVLIDAGCQLHVLDIDKHERNPVFSSDKDKICAELMNCDEEQLFVKDGKVTCWVYFVYGNDGYDVISDYSSCLEDILQPVVEYAQTFEPQY
jgi:hypothetical protein